MANRKIMIVDDEEDFCFFAQKNLQGTGKYSVVYTTQAEKALGMARKEKPDLIFMDIMMPGGSGLDILKEMKNDPRVLSIPVVMVTAVDTEEAKLSAAQEYNDDYITKPVDFVKLQQKIEEIFAARYGQGGG